MKTETNKQDFLDQFKSENKMEIETLITKKLSIPQQNNILKTLFGFVFVDVNKGHSKFAPHYVLYDEDGNEFFGINENLKFDFSTLEGIFAYNTYRAKNQGYEDHKSELRKLLGL